MLGQTTSSSPRRAPATVAVALLAVTSVAVLAWSRPAEAAGPTFTGGQQVTPYEGRASQSAVASSGSKVLTVWHERVGDTNWGIYGRISSATTDSMGPRFTIAYTAGHIAQYPDVAWNGSNWLVVWQYFYGTNDYDIRGSLVSPTGGVSGFTTIEGNTSIQLYPQVTAGKDGEFFVVWEDHRNAATTLSDIYGRRITSTGSVDTTFPHYRLSYDLQGIQTDDTTPDIGYDKALDVFAFVYVVSGSSIRYRDFDRTYLYSGEVIVSRDSAHPASAPQVASDGRNLLVVFVDNKAPGLDLSAVSLGQDGTFSFPITTLSNGNETMPTVAFNGNYLVAWKDTRNGSGGDIYATRVKKDRTVLDGNGFLVTDYTPADEYPAVSNGTTKAGTFAISWNAAPSGQGTGIALYGIDHPAPK